jgi:hypothetical protein
VLESRLKSGFLTNYDIVVLCYDIIIY